LGSGLFKLINHSRQARLSPRDYELYSREAFGNDLLSSVLTASELIPCLRAGIKAQDLELFDNKLRFQQACRQARIPSPEIVSWTEGQKEYYSNVESESSDNSFNLFAKPLNGICGKGAIKIKNLGNGRIQWGKRKSFYNQTEIKGLVLAHARECKDDIIIQRCLENHPSIEQFSGKALATVRVCSCRIQNKPSLILATLRCPNTSSHVDNFAQGGLAAPISIQTGKVTGLACQKDGRFGVKWVTSHPHSQIAFTGLSIPYWKEVLQLVQNSHTHWSKQLPSAGWDVAILPTGPTLIEANPIWCADVAQLPNQKGLLHTPFKEHILEEW
jgi:hypothetical protein